MRYAGAVSVSSPDGPPHPFQPRMVESGDRALASVSSPDGPPHPFQLFILLPLNPFDGGFKPRRAASSIPTAKGEPGSSSYYVFQAQTGRLIHSNPLQRRHSRYSTVVFQAQTGRLIHSNTKRRFSVDTQRIVSSPDGPPHPFQRQLPVV